MAGTAVGVELFQNVYIPTPSPAVASSPDGELSQTLGVLFILQNTNIEGTSWKLGEDLIFLLSHQGCQVIAQAYQLDEYGIGSSLQEAIGDLLTSLVDYRESLEKRAGQLGDTMFRHLQLLRLLLTK